MSTVSEIFGDVRKQEDITALAIAGACLTNDMIHALARTLAGQTAESIEAVFHTVLPREEARSGILLPWLVPGDLHEFPTYAHDLAVLVIGMYAGNAIYKTEAELLITAAPTLAVSNARSINVGSAIFYMDINTVVDNPAGLHRMASTITPEQLMASQGLSARLLGTGFSGMSRRKGTLQATNVAFHTPTMRGTPGQDTATVNAAAAAAAMEQAK